MATAGPINRTLLQSYYQNAGDVYDDNKTEGAFGTLADQMDANYDFVSGLVAGGVLQPYPAFLSRQALINGNFDVWQRGTSFTGPGGSYGYTADRWAINTGQVSQQAFAVGQTAVPNNPKYFLRHDCSSAPADPQLIQNIEDVQTFAGQKVTLSFWAKANASITFSEGGYFIQKFGSGGSADVTTNFGAFSLTTTWQKFTKTVTLPSISGKTVGANNCLCVRFDPQNATSVIFDIAQVQVNAGDQALPFQPRSLAEELQLCQRYYEKSYDYGTAPAASATFGAVSAVSVSSGVLIGPRFKVQKRISSPTVTIYSPTGTQGKVWNSLDVDASSGVVGANIGDSGFRYVNCTGAGLSIGVIHSYHYTCDAEL